MLTIENILIFTSGSVLGYLLRLLVEHSLAKSRDSLNRENEAFNRASSDFYQAFIAELTALDPSGPNSGVDPYDLLSKAAQKHKEAIIKFKKYLHDSVASDLEAAWQRYYRHHNYPSHDIVCLEQYSCVCGNEEKKERRKRARDRLSDIVAFAKIK